MTDEKLIYEYLTENFLLVSTTTLFKFDVIDKNNNNKPIGLNEFLCKFKMIFGEYEIYNGKSSVDVCQEWFSHCSNVFFSKLYSKINEIGYDKGTKHLIEELYVTLNSDKNLIIYQMSIILSIVKEKYFNEILRPKLDSFILNNDLEQLNSHQLIDRFNKEFPPEETEITNQAHTLLNNVYFSLKIKPKLDDILKQIILRLGTRNWEMIRIGHGKITYEQILKTFSGEHSEQLLAIERTFNDWYSLKVIEASQKTIFGHNEIY